MGEIKSNFYILKKQQDLESMIPKEMKNFAMYELEVEHYICLSGK